jgi:circadian clock protein KaiC
MKQVITGIKGLDTLLKGGLPKGSTNLVSGTPGSGKTILSMQFLVNGYLQAKEKGFLHFFRGRC